MASHFLIPRIAIRKSNDLTRLQEQVELAKKRVALQQAIADALQSKFDQFAGFLSLATNNQTSAQTNYNLVKDAVANARSLAKSFDGASDKAHHASDAAMHVSAQVAHLIRKLIFSVEVINKLAQMINKQKVVYPLLPDGLIANMAKANASANNAVALTLTALQSCYAAESTILGSVNLIDQAKNGSATLRDGMQAEAKGLMALFLRAHKDADLAHHKAKQNNEAMITQLAHAQADLALATMNLNSFKAGLAAATAAAYAAA